MGKCCASYKAIIAIHSSHTVAGEMIIMGLIKAWAQKSECLNISTVSYYLSDFVKKCVSVLKLTLRLINAFLKVNACNAYFYDILCTLPDRLTIRKAFYPQEAHSLAKR